MAGVGHFYMTGHGNFKAAWSGETGQVGARFVVMPQRAPDAGPVVQLVDGGPISETFIERDTADFSVAQTFDWNPPGTGSPWDRYADDAAKDMFDLLTGFAGLQSSIFTWTHIKIAPIELGTGKYLAPATTYTFKTPINPSGASPLPPEVAIAVSLRTPVVGKRGRGRMYVPAVTMGPANTDAKVLPATRTSLTNLMRTFVTDIRNLPGADLSYSDVLIMSANSRTGIAPNEVRCGDHFDAQRRRQHQVDEVYTSLPIA